MRDAIVEASGVRAGDLVIEIGPGKGALTRALAMRASAVVAVEVDSELAACLDRELADFAHVHIIHADALSCDIGQLVVRYGSGGSSPLRSMVVANLPYYITTPVLRKLLSASSVLASSTLMVQLEVAQKLTAAPGRPGYGELSLLARYHTRPEIMFTVGPESFEPPPSVQSAVVKMTAMQSERAVDADPSVLFEVARAGFAERRKNIRNALAQSALFCGDRSLVTRVLERAGIDGRLRAEQLGLAEFARLAGASVELGAICPAEARNYQEGW